MRYISIPTQLFKLLGRKITSKGISTEVTRKIKHQDNCLEKKIGCHVTIVIERGLGNLSIPKKEA